MKTENSIAPAFARARQALLDARTPGGHWEGRLSSSALSTATAVVALHLAGPDGRYQYLIRAGLQWLDRTQCQDGGWGDTGQSLPNLSTTLLVWSAFGLTGHSGESVSRCESWIAARTGGLEPPRITATLTARYGKDRTFSVPILMTCALGRRLGKPDTCWKMVPQLPFELAALPRSWFAALRLPVVSYALPALIAIGQVRFHHRPGNPLLAPLRRGLRARTLRLLREIQPPGGGWLEATPLTSFVTMALASMGLTDHPVVHEAAGFLVRSARADGSWPIDTNLATWATTLALKALGPTLPGEALPAPLQWLVNQQTTTVHPYTLSAPGAWAWTDLPGGVPDADDTAGALLALAESGGLSDPSAATGIAWLCGLQNGDGGIPTFCRGWGTLPFDRSAPDLTAHALAALQAWRGRPGISPEPAMRRALHYLIATQRPDGSWDPLWFGNEHAPGETNPVYGTAVVLKFLTTLPAADFPDLPGLCARAAAFLTAAQHADGGWSGCPGAGPPSIEETATALEALTRYHTAELPDSVHRGAAALLRLTDDGRQFPPTPIGLYFARLWYFEDLYPLLFATSALRLLAARLPQTSGHG